MIPRRRLDFDEDVEEDDILSSIPLINRNLESGAKTDEAMHILKKRKTDAEDSNNNKVEESVLTILKTEKSEQLLQCQWQVTIMKMKWYVMSNLQGDHKRMAQRKCLLHSKNIPFCGFYGVHPDHKSLLVSQLAKVGLK